MPGSVRTTAAVPNSRRVRYDAAFEDARPRLVQICRSLVGDEAEDVAQEVYLVGRSRLHQLRDMDRISSWLVRIAVNECYQRRRRGQILIRLLPSLFRPEPTSANLDLRDLLQRLPYKERTIVVLHYGHGLSLVEIADTLGVKAATVRSQLFRARATLRKQLHEDPASPDLTGRSL